MSIIDDIAVSLIYCASFFLVAYFITLPKRDDTAFIRFSVIFMTLFFIIPVIMSNENDRFYYADRVFYYDTENWLKVALSLWAFMAGFIVRDLILTSRKFSKLASARSYRQVTSRYYLNSQKTALLVAVSCALLLTTLLLSPASETIYLQRRGEAQGSHLFLMFNMLTNYVFFAGLFAAVALKWNVISAAMIVGHIVFLLSGSPGRFSLGIDVLIAVVMFTRISTVKLVAVIPVLILVGMPLILNGKIIIYSLIVLNKVPEFSVLYDYTHIFSDFVNNFGHPMASLYSVNDTLELTGVRLFYDMFQGFLFYLRAFGINAGDSLTYFNTESLLGVRESIVPPGYLAFGYMQASYAGIFMMGIFYRSLFYFTYYAKMFRLIRGEAFLLYVSLLAANTFYHGEIRILVVSYIGKFAVMYLCISLCTDKRNAVGREKCLETNERLRPSY